MAAADIMDARDVLLILLAAFAKQEKLMALRISAVIEILGTRLANITFSNDFGFIAEINGHAIIKCVKRTFPMRRIGKLISVADNAAFNLINLFETSIDHYRREDFAADTASAVSNYRFIL